MLELPKTFKGMKLVKCYDDYVLYKNKYYRECYKYFELGLIKQTENYEKERKIGSGYNNTKQALIQKQVRSMSKN